MTTVLLYVYVLDLYKYLIIETKKRHSVSKSRVLIFKFSISLYNIIENIYDYNKVSSKMENILYGFVKYRDINFFTRSVFIIILPLRGLIGFDEFYVSLLLLCSLKTKKKGFVNQIV